MAHINRVARLRDCGIYRDFTWADDVPDFRRYNLIYGGNGTGKTTLSRLMGHLESRQVPDGKDVVFRIDGSEVNKLDFSRLSVPVRVFNRDFMAQHVFPHEPHDMPPILVLGADSIERRRTLQRRRQAQSEARSSWQDARTTRENAAKAFDRFCAARAKDIKVTLRSPGENPYNSYDRRRFTADAAALLLADDHSINRLTDQQRDMANSICQSTPKNPLPELGVSLPDMGDVRDHVSRLLARTVVSTALESLRNDRELAQWTRSGLALHRERSTSRCLFCEQLVSRERLRALEQHFSAQYAALMEDVEDWVAKIDGLIKATEGIRSHVPHRAEIYCDLTSEFRAARSVLDDAVTSVRDALKSMNQALERKRDEPFVPNAGTVKLFDDGGSALEPVNVVIRKHNEMCRDFQGRVERARKNIALDAISRSLDEFVRHKAALDTATAGEERCEREMEALTQQIEQLQREVTEHRRPADELNDDLYHYLGHRELQLRVQGAGYSIVRSGRTAKAVSEGERTAIALLYFLKSLQDKRFDLSNGIVVLDDPVSSLDANALYLASSFIQERTKDAGQVFVLTHSFAFLRRMRDWIRHEKKHEAEFFMVVSTLEGDERASAIHALDPILRDFESEYHYLFACCHRAAKGSDAHDLKRNYNLPNMARRVLEVFLDFRFPQRPSKKRRSLWRQLKQSDFDPVRRRRIISFLNTYSHGGGARDPERDITGLTEAPAVMMDVLDLIRSEDPHHYAGMEIAVGETVG